MHVILLIVRLMCFGLCCGLRGLILQAIHHLKETIHNSLRVYTRYHEAKPTGCEKDFSILDQCVLNQLFGTRSLLDEFDHVGNDGR